MNGNIFTDGTDITLEFLCNQNATHEDLINIAETTKDNSFVYDLLDQGATIEANFFIPRNIGYVCEDCGNQIYYCSDNDLFYVYNEAANPCMDTNGITYEQLVSRYIKEENAADSYGSVSEAMSNDQLANVYHKKESICMYSGYKLDVLDVKRKINTNSIISMMKELKLHDYSINAGIPVVVHPTDFTPADNKKPSKEIHVVNREVFNENYNGGYENYLVCNMISFIYLYCFPNANCGLVYDLAKWKSGLYDDYKLEGLGRSTYAPKEAIDKLFAADGYEGFIDLLEDSAGTKAAKALVTTSMKPMVDQMKKMKQNFEGVYEADDASAKAPEKKMQKDKVDDDHDWSVDGLPKLARRIKMNNKKGAYKLKQVKGDIEDTMDTSEYNPKIRLDADEDEKATKDEIDNRRMPVHTADLLQAAKKTPAFAAPAGGGAKQEIAQIELDENCLFIYNGETVMMIGEAVDSDRKYNKMLYTALYKDRLRTNKDVLEIYKRAKTDMPFIRYTYLVPERYKLNTIIDTFFYNQTFFANNVYNRDRAIDLYAELLDRLINDKRYTQFTKQTVFIPVIDWNDNPATKMWMYTEDINPISMIIRLLRRDPNRVKDIFGNRDVVFMGTNNYFKVNFTKLEINDSIIYKIIYLVKKLIALKDTVEQDPTDEPMNDSPKAITMDIIDKLDKNQGIKITNMAFTGIPMDAPHAGITNSRKKAPTDVDKEPDDNVVSVISKDTKAQKKKENAIKATPEPEADKEKSIPKNQKEVDKDITEKQKAELVDNIVKAAGSSASSDEAIEKMDNVRIAKIIADLSMEDESDNKVNKARAARMSKLHDDLLTKQVQGISVKDMINNPSEKLEVKEQLKQTELPVQSINDEWKNMTYTNFDKTYNVNADIVKMLDAMSSWTYPVAVRNIDVHDNSTSEDYVDLWTVDCEDANGKRFKLKFDVPKFMNNNRYMMLRGNQKTIETQFFLMPILKTDDDAAQIVSNYNKIFVRRFNTAVGKSNADADKVVRALKKYQGTKIKISYGDNSRICAKYDLPIDYIDLSRLYDKIDIGGKIIFYFNQDEIREKYDVNNAKGIPVAVRKNDKDPKKWDILYIGGSDSYDTSFSSMLLEYMSSSDSNFHDIANAIPRAAKYTYSKASILNAEIPVILLCGYAEGLTTTLTKAGISYDLKEKLPSYAKDDMHDYIKFEDGFLIYVNTPEASMLMNGLKECDTKGYQLGDINSKMMYTDFLDGYCSRLTTDGLDTFYDCMIDPITKEVMHHYNLPDDYVSALIYANDLLVDNAYIKHTDTKARRIRRAELVAGYVYKALTDSYGSYTQALKHTRTGGAMTMKQSAVIDKILLDPTEKDYSTNNMLTDVEATNSISTKGLSGMNSERSYDLDKRTYDESMLNVLGMSTGFAANVGMTRQATMDMNVVGNRGYVEGIGGDTKQLTDVKTLTATEAITPMGTTHDDPFRTAMTFIQKSKHGMRCYEADPLLVTNGADEALPYMASDIFAFKAKKNGKVVELVPDSYMILEYKDGTSDYVNLENTVQKNSDGGFHVPLQLKTDLKAGSTVKENQIVAYDPLSVGNNLGEDDNLAFKAGTLAKVAILNTEEGFEDSAIMSPRLSKAMSCDVVKVRSVYLPKETNIYNVLSKGMHIEEGDIMMSYQAPYESEDLEILQRNLAGSEEELSTLGRKPVRAECTGTLVDVRIYRTCEIADLSPSLKKLVNAYEKPIKAKKLALEKHGIETYQLPATYKLPATGKLKNCEDGVMIEFCQQYTDIPAIGDKIVWYSANKGVNKALFPEGEEPYTDLRPHEVIDGLITNSSVNGRMVCSIGEVGALNKLMIELDRTCKEMLGIPFDDTKA